MSARYGIRRADGDDVVALLELRAEAERWLQARGIRQWTADYQDYAHGVLTHAAEAGLAWLVVDRLMGGDRVATVTLSAEPDLDFWGSDPHPNDALYLAKMIVARRRAGSGLGSAILNWASLRAAQAGRGWLRLDVRRDNQALHRYYLARGFDHVRTVVPAGRRTESGALFQRPAGTVTDAPVELVVDGCGCRNLAPCGEVEPA